MLDWPLSRNSLPVTNIRSGISLWSIQRRNGATEPASWLTHVGRIVLLLPSNRDFYLLVDSLGRADGLRVVEGAIVPEPIPPQRAGMVGLERVSDFD